MAFKPLVSPRAAKASPKIRMSARELKASDTVKITLAVHGDILASLAGKGDKYAIAVGGGEDAGWLHFTRDPAGTFSPTKIGRGANVFNLGAVDFAPDVACASTVCDFRRVGDALLIKLPEWCFVEKGEGEAETEERGEAA